MDRACVLHLDASDNPQGRRFTTARGAQKAGNLPRLHVEAYVINDATPAKRLGDIADL